MKFPAIYTLLFSALLMTTNVKAAELVEDYLVAKVSGFSNPSELFEKVALSQISSIAGYIDVRDESIVSENESIQYGPSEKDPSEQLKSLMQICPNAALQGQLYSMLRDETSVLTICVFLMKNSKEAQVLLYGSSAESLLSVILGGVIPNRYANRAIEELRSSGYLVEIIKTPTGKLITLDASK